MESYQNDNPKIVEDRHEKNDRHKILEQGKVITHDSVPKTQIGSNSISKYEKSPLKNNY